MLVYDSIVKAVETHDYAKLLNVEIVPTKSHTFVKEDNTDVVAIDWGERTLTFLQKPKAKNTRRMINSILYHLRTGYKMEDKNNVHTLAKTNNIKKKRPFVENKTVRFWK